MIRSNLSTSWIHQADSVGSCPRNGEAAACGIYFPITDVIGKPVLMLNAAGRVAGTGEYDPFGHVNRVFIDAETPHPYDSATTGTFADFTQFLGTGVSLDMRLLVDMVDLNVTTSADPLCTGGTPVDFLEVRDGATTALLTSLPGAHRGLITTNWLQPSAGRLKLGIAGPGHCTVAGPTCTTTCDAVTQKTEKGVVAASYEYRRYETGQVPLWTPLRFPGQYYDAESDLLENWNRYLDPALGRYFQAEPLLEQPTLVASRTTIGLPMLLYAYSHDNPITYTDEDGLATYGKSCDVYLDEARRMANRIIEEFNKNIRTNRCTFDSGHLKEIESYQSNLRQVLSKLKKHCSKFLLLENLGKEVLSMQDLADADTDVLSAMLLLQCKLRCQEIPKF